MVLVLLGLAGYFGYRSFSARAEAPNPFPPGTLPLPVSAGYLPPFTRIWPRHLVPQPTKQEAIPSRVITDPRKLIGRVLAVEREAGFAFRERDFLPQGTPRGPKAGIPHGWVAITIDAKQIEGTAGLLNVGDHLVVATARRLARGRATSSPTSSRVLAADARVVAPFRQRTVLEDENGPADAPASLVPSSRQPSRGRQTPKLTLEMTIAVQLSEALSISEALLASRLRIFLRRAEDEGVLLTSAGLFALEPPERIELIMGSLVSAEVAPRSRGYRHDP